MPNHLIVIYGPPLSGKTTLAWEVARALGEKSVVVSVDQLLNGTIAVADEDAQAELDMVQVQLRLLVANYLKNRYHVVLEGPFIYDRGGRLHNFESDIDQLIALMRHLTDEALIVRLDASTETLAARAQSDGRAAELEPSLRIRDAFRSRSGARYQAHDSSSESVEQISRSVLAALQ
jgi:shikimate kinase